MARFLNKIIVKKIDSRLWMIYEDLEYITSKELITIPKGFMTDFASVPRIFWTIFPPDGAYTGAAIVHDFLYSIKDRKRKEADDIFLEAMESLNVKYMHRYIMYYSVRLFGNIVWNNRDIEGFSVGII